MCDKSHQSYSLSRISSRVRPPQSIKEVVPASFYLLGENCLLSYRENRKTLERGERQGREGAVLQIGSRAEQAKKRNYQIISLRDSPQKKSDTDGVGKFSKLEETRFALLENSYRYRRSVLNVDRFSR